MPKSISQILTFSEQQIPHSDMSVHICHQRIHPIFDKKFLSVENLLANYSLRFASSYGEERSNPEKRAYKNFLSIQQYRNGGTKFLLFAAAFVLERLGAEWEREVSFLKLEAKFPFLITDGRQGEYRRWT
ncbi:hypothetical protein, partial [uncultured Fibrobacter sp.]|uniref:hypothetical protein n=1 Tax=uncultured Fibrobacter sp. TaxID=261512 RepID=UPI0025967EF9